MPEYTLTAQDSSGKKYNIVTSDRGRVLRYAALFNNNSDYSEVKIEVGGKSWVGADIRRLP